MNAPHSTDLFAARSIMGKNFLGMEEVFTAYGIALGAEQYLEVPYTEETLRACTDTHVLVAGAPLSVNDVRALAGSAFYDTWYHSEPFATTKKVGARWYLLRKEPVPHSFRKNYVEQTALLTKEEAVPFACEVTYIVILYWLTHRERLLPDVYARCQDKDSDGLRVVVGGFDSDGFDVGCYWDGSHDGVLGLASSVPPRKS